MREVGFEEFTNQRGDEVLAQLSEDSAGVFHLIVKAKVRRQSEETRVFGGSLIKIPVTTFTDETKHARLPNERTAMVEFKMACMMHNMPGFGSNEFQDWLRQTEALQ